MSNPELKQLSNKSSWRAHLTELTTEVILVLLSLGLLVFLRVASLVVNGDTTSFDRSILLAMRQPDNPSHAIGPEWMDVVVRDITALGGVFNLTLLTLCVVFYLFLQKKNRLAVFVALAVIGGTLLNTALKHWIARPRPDLFPHATDAAFSSFPSGHAMMSTVVFLTLGSLMAFSTNEAKMKAFYLTISILLPVLVGFSRVYLGVHWPTDILAGWVAGATWALLCLLLGRLFIPDRPQPLQGQ